MGAGENECQISQNYISHISFSEFYRFFFFFFFTISLKFGIHFLGLP